MQWFYAVGGQQKGPVSDEEFQKLVTAGVVKSDTLVWRDGWANWRAYGTVTAGNAAAVSGGGEDADTAVCAVSGQRRPKSEMLQFEGRWVSAEHKDEFFQRLREGVRMPHEVEYASFGKRWAAKIVDGLILYVFGAVAGAAVGVAMRGDSAAPLIAQAVGVGGGILYNILFIRKYDATPGKLALGLRVLRADGSKLGVGRIVARYFAEWISTFTLMIGYLMAAFDKEQHRALHDRIVDTRVVVANK